jgi:hypothetical protein
MSVPEEVTRRLKFAEIEQRAGGDLLPPTDLRSLDRWRERAYKSYEAFLRQRLVELDETRPTLWKRDYSSLAAYQESVGPMRRRLKAMFGWWVEPEAREPIEKRDAETLLDTAEFRALRYAVPILPGIETYAVELIPKSQGPHPGLLAQHGYGGTPEGVCGLGPEANRADYSYRSLGLRAVRRGFHVVAIHHPTTYGSPEIRSVRPLPTHPQFSVNYGKDRLHRLAILAGGTLFGLDLMASSRGVDVLLGAGVPCTRIGMYGLSQGGQTALYLAALDERIRASVSSAWFNWRLPKMVGPVRGEAFLDVDSEDKFFSELIRCFADSDVVSLIAPRAFAVETGLHDAAVDIEKAEAEFQRARGHYEALGVADRIEFIPHAEGHVSATRRAFGFLQQHLGEPSARPAAGRDGAGGPPEPTGPTRGAFPSRRADPRMQSSSEGESLP